MVKVFFPIVAEISTAVECGAMLVCSGFAKLDGLDDHAKEYQEAAKKGWKDYKETSFIGGKINADIQRLKGNHDEALRIEGEQIDAMSNAVSSMVDSTPGVGHIKAVVHQLNGEEEKAKRVFESATRTSVVFAAGIPTGGLGAACVAGMLTGTTFDGIATYLDPDGGNRGVFGAADPDKTINEKFMAGLTPVGDAMTGASGGKFGKKIRSKIGQAKLKNTFKKNKVENPKQATKSAIKAGKEGKKAWKEIAKKEEKSWEENE